jgi:hypothetical protein
MSSSSMTCSSCWEVRGEICAGGLCVIVVCYIGGFMRSIAALWHDMQLLAC